MDAIKALFDNEKGIVGVALIIGATVLTALKIFTPQEWKEYTTWIFGIYAGTTALHGGLVAIGTKSPSLLTPSASAVPVAVSPEKGSVNLGLILIIMVAMASFMTPLLLTTGCGAKTKAEIKAVENGLISCAKADLNQVVGPDGLTLAMDVVRIVVGDANAVDQLLSDLATKVGEPTLACAEKTVRDVFTASRLASGVPSTAAESPIVARLNAQITKHGYKFQ